MKEMIFCEKYISLQTDFSDHFFGQALAAETTEVGVCIEKHKVKSTQRG